MRPPALPLRSLGRCVPFLRSLFFGLPSFFGGCPVFEEGGGGSLLADDVAATTLID